MIRGRKVKKNGRQRREIKRNNAKKKEKKKKEAKRSRSVRKECSLIAGNCRRRVVCVSVLAWRRPGCGRTPAAAGLVLAGFMSLILLFFSFYVTVFVIVFVDVTG